MHRDKENGVKEKKCLTVGNIEKKEVKRINAYKVKQNPAKFQGGNKKMEEI